MSSTINLIWTIETKIRKQIYLQSSSLRIHKTSMITYIGMLFLFSRYVMSTLCHPVDYSTLNSSVFTISWSLLKFTSIESVMLSNHLILYHPLLLLPSIFPSIRVFPNEWALRIRWPKYYIQFQHQSFQWIFRVDFLYDWLVWSPCCSRDSQESSLAPQFESINSSALSLLFGPTLLSVHNYWKNHSSDYTDLCWK